MTSYPKLYTEAGERLLSSLADGGIPWDVYPRPLLERDSYLNLNGSWSLSVTEPSGRSRDFTITLPFPPESLLSGVNERFPEGSTLLYRRELSLPSGFLRDRVILHVGACDNSCEVSVNGVAVGAHVGGYDPFSFDITDCLAEQNVITIRATDRLDGTLPYGKQRHKRGGMWYTPISGIWQTVWLESVPERHVTSLDVTVEGSNAHFTVGGVRDGRITVTTPEGERSTLLSDGLATLELGEPRRWSPADPYLYRYEVESGEDRVRSYFAVREISIETVDGTPRLCLNHEPIFLNGLLDQGYFSDGIYTPAAPESYTEDILAARRLGINTLRKHIKLEPAFFYAECDRLGMLVVQDMVQNGKYSFLRDTALPTVGLIRRDDRRAHRDPETRRAFIEGMERTVGLLRAHPSIVVWTVFNEGWGQFCSTELYRRLRALDPTRPIDSASGWFAGGESDFDSRHIYFKPIRLKPSGKPIFLSEFGGYCLRVDGHLFGDGNYGYRRFDSQTDFEAAMRRLYEEELLPAVAQGLCGAICTQLSDVEDETNGILTYDRRVAKLPSGFFEPINRRIDELIRPKK